MFAVAMMHSFFISLDFILLCNFKPANVILKMSQKLSLMPNQVNVSVNNRIKLDTIDKIINPNELNDRYQEHKKKGKEKSEMAFFVGVSLNFLCQTKKTNYNNSKY